MKSEFWIKYKGIFLIVGLIVGMLVTQAESCGGNAANALTAPTKRLPAETQVTNFVGHDIAIVLTPTDGRHPAKIDVTIEGDPATIEVGHNSTVGGCLVVFYSGNIKAGIDDFIEVTCQGSP